MLLCVVRCMVPDVSNLETSGNAELKTASHNTRPGSTVTSRSPYISQNGIKSSHPMNSVSTKKSKLMHLSVSKYISKFFTIFSLNY